MKKLCGIYCWMLCVICQLDVIQIKGSRLSLENKILKDVNRYKVNQKIETLYEPKNFEAFYYRKYANESSSTVGAIQREGSSTTESSCSYVREVPEELRHYLVMRPVGISQYYQKYTEAYSIPVIASADVPDEALERACYVLRFLLADRLDLREQYYRHYGRVVVMATDQLLHQLPDYHFLDYYMNATRGVGAIPLAPLSTIGEENVLCYRDSTFYDREDLTLREIAMGILFLAARYINPHYYERVQKAYHNAMARETWQNSYSNLSPDAYFGEGVQSFFEVNGYSHNPMDVKSHVNSRAQLMVYDTDLFWLIHELFPCGNYYIKRCRRRGNEKYQKLTMNCYGHSIDQLFSG